MKKRIMIFCDSYLPGYKSGGGMWTVVNLVDRFSDRFEFFVVTRNCDGKVDATPYTDVKYDDWNEVGSAKVFYASAIKRKTFCDLIENIAPDAVYLNSAFSRLAVTFLSARFRKSIRSVPVVIAPCGEFSEAALGLKSFKKAAFLRFALTTGLYRNVLWKASSDIERDEISRTIGRDVEVWVAPDPTPRALFPDYEPTLKPQKEPGDVRFVFFARVSRIKNLHFFLDILKTELQGKIHLDIIGPAEDMSYVRECEILVGELPDNVSVTFVGALRHDKALDRVLRSHFFVLPTLSENFGYAIIEAMAAGCPVLISDQNPWSGIEKNGGGWRIPLHNKNVWKNRVTACLEMDNDEFQCISSAARKYAVEWLTEKDGEDANEKVLLRAVGDPKAGLKHVGQ